MNVISHESSPTSSDAAPSAESSLLTRLFEEMQRETNLHVSFEDLTGIVLDNPDIRLPYSFRIHTCDFCLHAKSSPASHQHCVRNKMAANRVALQRRSRFSGQCHLGMTDLVKPLLLHDQVLGVFYFGSFVLKGTEARARKRILTFCKRHGFDPRGYLRALDDVPHLDPDRLPHLWRRLDLVADLTRSIIENTGIPTERYRTRSGSQFATWNNAMPSLVRTVVNYINHNYSNPLRVVDIAAVHRCNPDYLSRIFRRTVGLKLVDYIHRVRMDHAKRLLVSPRFSAGEIGFMVGFQDHSHFGKVFRQIVGMTPHAYRMSAQCEKPDDESGAFSTFEYSNVHPFNPQFGGSPSGQGKLIM